MGGKLEAAPLHRNISTSLAWCFYTKHYYSTKSRSFHYENTLYFLSASLPHDCSFLTQSLLPFPKEVPRRAF